MFDSLDIGASALLAQRVRMDTIAGNVANINTTRNEKGQPIPYRRRLVTFAPTAPDGSSPGVRVASIEKDMSPFNERYEPGNRDADARGAVFFSKGRAIHAEFKDQVGEDGYHWTKLPGRRKFKGVSEDQALYRVRRGCDPAAA